MWRVDIAVLGCIADEVVNPVPSRLCIRGKMPASVNKAMVISCHLFGNKPFPEPTLVSYQLQTREEMQFESKYQNFQTRKVVLIIARTTAVSHRTAIPHSAHHLLYMLEWSLSGHCSVCINHSAHNFKDDWRKPRTEDIFNFLNICHINSIQVLNLSGCRCRCLQCPSNVILKINWKDCCWYWDPLSETGSLSEQSKHKLNPRQTKIGS